MSTLKENSLPGKAGGPLSHCLQASYRSAESTWKWETGETKMLNYKPVPGPLLSRHRRSSIFTSNKKGCSYLVLVAENIWVRKVPFFVQHNTQVVPCCTLVLAHSNTNVSLQCDRVLRFKEQIQNIFLKNNYKLERCTLISLWMAVVNLIARENVLILQAEHE